MQVPLTWMARYRQCILGRKSNREAVGGVIHHDGSVLPWSRDAEFLRATVRAWQQNVAMRQERVKVAVPYFMQY